MWFHPLTTTLHLFTSRAATRFLSSIWFATLELHRDHKPTLLYIDRYKYKLLLMFFTNILIEMGSLDKYSLHVPHKHQASCSELRRHVYMSPCGLDTGLSPWGQSQRARPVAVASLPSGQLSRDPLTMASASIKGTSFGLIHQTTWWHVYGAIGLVHQRPSKQAIIL